MRLRHLPCFFLLACGAPATTTHDAKPAVAAAPAYASEDDAAVPIAADDAVRGDRLAPVTLVVFSDFECPFCGRFDGTLDRLSADYGDKLRVVFKNDPLPSHPHARLAAEIGQGVLALAGQEAFWRYELVAFHKQREMSPEALRSWAIGAGADPRALEDGLARGTWTAKIERDVALASQLKVDGTPMSWVNGVLVPGARPYEDFKAIIDDQLAEAQKSLASGTPKDLLYKKLALANFRPSEDDDDDSEAARAAAEAREAAALKVVHKVAVGPGPVRGPADAPLTIVEFSDFQCPFCKRGEDVVAKIREAYGTKVRVVWRDDPLSMHPRAEPAAELARAARAQKGDAGFWTVHDALFASQPSLEDADLERIAREAKLDVKQAMLAVSTHKYKSAIDDDVVVADDFKCQGTPCFFINGHHVSGAKSFEKLKPLLDDELTKAEALVKAGTPKAKVYETTIKDGLAPAEPEKKAIAAPAANAPFRGAANAKVVIQEVGDFQCPYCRRGDATMDALLEAYPGKIKVVWRDKPLSFHKNAPLAAEAAREAYAQKGNEGFQRMAKLMFENQKALAREDLDGYAKVIGLDMPRFAKALDDRTHKAVVDADTKVADDAGVSGTPGFFVGPYFVEGAASYAHFRKLVELTLKQ